MTTTDSSTAVHHEKKLFSTILLTGLLAGALDISAAMIKFYIERGRGPAPIFKYIARGVFGDEVTTGGQVMIIWGIVFHFLIAMIFTAFLFLVYPTIIKWIKNPVLTGILYGLFIWVIMNRVVIPLSNIPAPKVNFDVKDAVKQALILICMIGIPVSLIAHRYYSRVSRERIVH